MCLDETQRFQMALDTDFILSINTRHVIKRKMQKQRDLCTVDGSLREIVFTPRTDRSIRRHSIRTTLFFSLSSPISFFSLFFFLFSRYIPFSSKRFLNHEVYPRGSQSPRAYKDFVRTKEGLVNFAGMPCTCYLCRIVCYCTNGH